MSRLLVSRAYSDFCSTGSIPGFCAMCQLRNHVTRVMGSVGGTVRPVPIVQNIRGSVFMLLQLYYCVKSL